MQINNIDPNKPIVALTFDDGPSEYTSRILDTLQRYGGRVSFFVNGNRIEDNVSKIFRADQMDCEIICHAWDHLDLTTLSNEEVTSQLTRTIDAIAEVTGKTSMMFRPPYGSHNKKTLKLAKKLGLAVVNWSVDPKDWDTTDADAVLSHIVSNVKSGDIVLCHDVHESTARAMEMLIPALVKKECQLLTVSELLLYKYGSIEPGRLYPY